MKIFQLPDVNDIFRPLLSSISGVLMVNSDPGDKLPAIYAQLAERQTTNNTPAGASVLYTSYVPDGYIWWVQSIWIKYSGTATGRIFDVHIGQVSMTQNIWGTMSFPGAGEVSFNPNQFVLPGYRLAFGIYSAEAGKTQSIDVVGVTMRVIT